MTDVQFEEAQVAPVTAPSQGAGVMGVSEKMLSALGIPKTLVPQALMVIAAACLLMGAFVLYGAVIPKKAKPVPYPPGYAQYHQMYTQSGQ